MKAPSTITFFIGLLLGIAGTLIGHSVAQQGDTKSNDHVIVSEGFRKIDFKNDRVLIEVVTRVDEATLEVAKTLDVSTEGFFRSYGAMQQLIAKLEKDGVIQRGGTTPPPESAAEMVQPPEN